MKAIIFNSGLGHRMGDETKTHHKSTTLLKNGETAVLGICVLDRADHIVVGDFRGLDLSAELLTGNGRGIEVELKGFLRAFREIGDALHNGHDPARSVDIGDMIVTGRRDLADVRRYGRNLVHTLERILNARLARDGESVKNGVGGAAHRHIESKSVVERITRDEILRQRSALLSHRDDALCGGAVKILTLDIYRENGSVSGKRKSKRLVKAVHRIRGEHAGATAAAGAARLFYLLKFL